MPTLFGLFLYDNVRFLSGVGCFIFNVVYFIMFIRCTPHTMYVYFCILYYSDMLVDSQILSYVANGEIKIEPFRRELVRTNSVDITLGDHFMWYMPMGDFVPHDEHVLDPLDGNESLTSDMWSVKNVKSYTLPPGGFVLARTVEHITLSNMVAARLEGRSSFARLGLSVHQTGGWIDAGFRGTITLEISNANPRPVRLTVGMQIAQLVFFRSEIPPMISYSERKDARYLDQIETTPTRISIGMEPKREEEETTT